MAQMKQLKWDDIPLNNRVTVGHNRTIYKPQADLLYCSLYDHTIAFFRRDSAGGFDVTLDHCGYMTTTTMAAMCDFARFVGTSFGVSRAKGKFTARYQIKRDQWESVDGDPRIYFHAPKIDPWSYGVIIGGVYPPILAIRTQTLYAAQQAAIHLRDMFPHLRADSVIVDELPEGQPLRYTPATNALRDCSQAYCVAWRGRGVELWEGGAGCGKVS